MQNKKFYEFLQTLVTPENTSLVESVAAGFMLCFESEIILSTRDDGKLPPIFTPEETDPNDPNWKSKIVNHVIQMLSQPGKTMRESEYRILLNPTAYVSVDGTSEINLSDYSQWIDFKERFAASHPEEIEALNKRAKFLKAVKSIDADRWVDKNGRSPAGKGKDFGKMSMQEMEKRFQEAKARKEQSKFSDLNQKLFR